MAIDNFTLISNNTSAAISEALSPFYSILNIAIKVVGGIVILYLLYLLFSLIHNLRKNRFLKIIANNVKEINDKISEIIKRQKTLETKLDSLQTKKIEKKIKKEK